MKREYHRGIFTNNTIKNVGKINVFSLDNTLPKHINHLSYEITNNSIKIFLNSHKYKKTCHLIYENKLFNVNKQHVVCGICHKKCGNPDIIFSNIFHSKKSWKKQKGFMKRKITFS